MVDYLFVPIVEGHGEVEAVPILIRRLAHENRPHASIGVNAPLRVKAGSFLNDKTYLTRYLELAFRKARQHAKGVVLILLDCEDLCPAHVGPALVRSATEVRNDVPILVVLAFREFETWFLAAAHSLRGKGGLPAEIEPPNDPERIRDAKGWLGARMPNGYNEPNDQPAFAAQFSFDAAQTIPSFARLRARAKEIFQILDAQDPREEVD
jgi:hypothetical protein